MVECCGSSWTHPKQLAGEFTKSQYNWKETKANTENTAESIFNRDSKNMQDLHENVNKVDTAYR